MANLGKNGLKCDYCPNDTTEQGRQIYVCERCGADVCSDHSEEAERRRGREEANRLVCAEMTRCSAERKKEEG